LEMDCRLAAPAVNAPGLRDQFASYQPFDNARDRRLGETRQLCQRIARDRPPGANGLIDQALVVIAGEFEVGARETGLEPSRDLRLTVCHRGAARLISPAGPMWLRPGILID